VTLLREPAAVGHAYFLFSVLCGDRCARDRAAAALGHRGIETRICWPLPVYRQPAYSERSIPRNPCPVAESVADRVLSLPIHTGLTHADVGHVCDVLLTALG
jgi:perosamine synthetase